MKKRQEEVKSEDKMMKQKKSERFTYPRYGVSIVAGSREEADKKLEKKLKSVNNK